jgi:hypothetical protein
MLIGIYDGFLAHAFTQRRAEVLLRDRRSVFHQHSGSEDILAHWASATICAPFFRMRVAANASNSWKADLPACAWASRIQSSLPINPAKGDERTDAEKSGNGQILKIEVIAHEIVGHGNQTSLRELVYCSEF